MRKQDWITVQKRLLKLGFNPGPIDGIRGRLTIGAVRAFQASRGLLADGIVGRQTFAALFGENAPTNKPSFDGMPWYEAAQDLIGLKEDTSSKSNPIILDMAEELDINYKDDDIPWCGLFVAHCIGSTLSAEPLPTVPLRARAWERFGDGCEPQLGAVMVFWRKTKTSGFGHVGFYAGEDKTHYHILGGNQSNAVNVKRITKARFLDARWPLTAIDPEGIKVAGDANAPTSDNNEA